jgi:uncharacterized protein
MVKKAKARREITRVPRVVLDTNIVLSALVFTHGRAVALRDAWQAGRREPHVSKTTAGELIRVPGYPKFKLSGEDQREFLADYLPYCRTVTMPARPPGTPACRFVPVLGRSESTRHGSSPFVQASDTSNSKTGKFSF